MKHFEIVITCHNQYGIELINESKNKMDFLKSAVLDNRTKSKYYIAKQKAHPFLQSDCDDFMMIEFWTDNFNEVEKYVDFLNKQYEDCIFNNVF